MNEMLSCGHAANATSDGKPCCAICDCFEVVKQPDLTNRKASCSSCGTIRPSSTKDLAFFTYLGEGSPITLKTCVCGYFKVAHDNKRVKCKQFRPVISREFDTYYCGCRGWD